MKYKELLELAAKAAGYEYAKNGGYIIVDGIPRNWNPLSDDGDALRLAVRLEMDVSFGLRGAVVEQSHGRKVQELDDNEPYVATRRAIVRAAAEIGRSMK